MKKSLLIIALGLTTIISFSPVQAKEDQTEEKIGFGSGLVIGAFAGGPIGAIVGAVSGAWLGEQVKEADKVDQLNEEIADNQIRLNSLQESLAEQNQYLDQAKILIAEQSAIETKVALNNELMTGLQIDLMFRTNSRKLESGAMEKIAPLVLMLEQFPQLELQLTGHGDILGSDEANREVAHQRTLTVRQSFLSAGIDAQRIHLMNSGRSQAEAAIEDIDGRALDRRVRIQFMQAVGKASLALQ